MKKPKPPVKKFNLRMPEDLMLDAAEEAEAMGISLNSYILLAVRNFIPYTRRQRPDRPAPAAKPAAPARPAAAPAGPTFRKVGRNDPCPCGSGRKAKQCHPEAC